MIEESVVVILAGGFGTRIKHLLPDIPKPMAMIAGRPFLEWVIRYYFGQGIKKFVLSTGYRSEVIEQYFESIRVPGTEVVCVQESEPLGTAGGFINAVSKSMLNCSVWLVVNGDSLVLTDIRQFILEVESGVAPVALLGLFMSDTSRYGSLAVNAVGSLEGFKEKRSGSGFINSGVYAIKSDVISFFPTAVPLSFETDVFTCMLLKSIKIGVKKVDAPFLDIGTPESLLQAEAFINENKSKFGGSD